MQINKLGFSSDYFNIEKSAADRKTKAESRAAASFSADFRERTAKTDRIEISPQNCENTLDEIKSRLQEETRRPTDTERLKTLRDRICKETYPIDPAELAHAMLNFC